MTGDDVGEDVAGSGGDRKLGLPPRVVDVLRQMSPYADRLTWSVSEDASSVSLALVWELQSSTAASSWRRHRRPAPVDRPPPADSTDVGLLQRLKRRLDQLPRAAPVNHPTGSARPGDEVAASSARGRGLLRRCVTSLTALRLWKTRQSQSSPSTPSDRLDSTITKHRQHRQRQHNVGDDDLFCRSRFTSVQVSRHI